MLLTAWAEEVNAEPREALGGDASVGRHCCKVF
jgi:hypothetical protein